MCNIDQLDDEDWLHGKKDQNVHELVNLAPLLTSLCVGTRHRLPFSIIFANISFTCLMHLTKSIHDIHLSLSTLHQQGNGSKSSSNMVHAPYNASGSPSGPLMRC